MRRLVGLAFAVSCSLLACSKPAEDVKPNVPILINDEPMGSGMAKAAPTPAAAAPAEASGGGCGGEMPAAHAGCDGKWEGSGGGCGGNCGKGDCAKAADGSCACGKDGSGAGCGGCGGGCGKGDCAKAADGSCGCDKEGSGAGCGGCGGGCGGAAAPAQAQQGGGHGDEMEELDNVPPDQIKAQPGLAVGDITRCPVSGEVFRIKANSPKVTVAGKDWYLCCRRCTARFESNPQKYTGGR